MENSDLNILRDIEKNERWLAGFESPVATDQALAAVRQAVRDELARKRTRAFAIRWRPWQGAMAAAAMLVISVGIVRFAYEHAEVTPMPDIADLALITDADTSIEDASLEKLSEMTIGESWALSGTSMYETFEDALSDDSEEPGEQGAMAPRFVANEAMG